MQSDIRELETYAKPMENPAEYLCCKIHPCILTTEAFNHACLSRSVLSVYILDCCDSFVTYLNYLQATTGRPHITSILCTVMDTWEGVTER